MLSSLVVSALVVLAQGSAPSPLRPPVPTTASAEFHLQRSVPPHFDANADYMSVGPMGAATPPDTIKGSGFSFTLEPSHHRLRVTISSSEGHAGVTIDDIVTGRADKRSVMAEYIFDSLSPDLSALRTRVANVPRAYGPEAGPPILWLSPTSFAWVRQDTTVFEQRADSAFQVTIRPRVR